MRKILIIISMLVCNTSFATTRQVDCRNIWVLDNNPFEEGLGVYGRIDVDEDSQTTMIKVVNNKLEYVSVGQMSWDAPTAKMKVTKKDTTVYVNTGSYSLMVRLYPTQRGVVILKKAQSEKWTPIASFDCSDVTAVYKAEIGHPNVKRVDPRRIDKKVLNNIDSVDVPFEMGDGYYDLIAYKLYPRSELKS